MEDLTKKLKEKLLWCKHRNSIFFLSFFGNSSFFPPNQKDDHLPFLITLITFFIAFITLIPLLSSLSF